MKYPYLKNEKGKSPIKKSKILISVPCGPDLNTFIWKIIFKLLFTYQLMYIKHFLSLTLYTYLLTYIISK